MDQYTEPQPATKLSPFDLYLQQDRQWPRRYRMQHAALMMKQAMSKYERDYWRGVLQSNERVNGEHQKPFTTRGWDDRTGHWKPVITIDKFWKEQK